jgi:hypothetical protein
MNIIETQLIQCPYCGESIEVLIDCSVPDQNYIEDCQVCCCPINVDVTVDHEGTVSVYVSSENE